MQNQKVLFAMTAGILDYSITYVNILAYIWSREELIYKCMHFQSDQICASRSTDSGPNISFVYKVDFHFTLTKLKTVKIQYMDLSLYHKNCSYSNIKLC